MAVYVIEGPGRFVHSAWASFSYYTVVTAIMGPKVSSLPRRITLEGNHHLRTRSIHVVVTNLKLY